MALYLGLPVKQLGIEAHVIFRSILDWNECLGGTALDLSDILTESLTPLPGI